MSAPFQTELSTTSRSSFNSNAGTPSNNYVRLDPSSPKGPASQSRHNQKKSASDLENQSGHNADNLFESRISVADKSQREMRQKRSFNTRIYRRLLGYSFRQW